MNTAKVVIIGSGPAGYTAAIYTARAQLQPVLFAGPKAGGQLMLTTDIENFPGFKDGVAGPELMIQMLEQAQRFGTDIRYDYVTAVDFSQRPFKVWTSAPQDIVPETLFSMKPEEYQAARQEIMKTQPTLLADSVIIATGASSVMLQVPGEHEFIGRGVSTCAVCDAAFYRDKVTFVAGGGDSAMEDALALTKFAKSVTLIHRRDTFKASKIMQERVLKNPKVQVLWNTTIQEVLGDSQVTAIRVQTPEGIKELPAEGVFVAIGHTPVTSLFADQVLRDEHGYIITRQSPSRQGVEAAQAGLSGTNLIAYPTMTSVEGVFAAGDNVDLRYRQAITAAGQGCSAALDAERWLESQA